MRIFDSNFKANFHRYLLQCLFATIIIFVVLFLADTIFNMTIVASLGASTFIAFTMPHTNSSRPRYLIGGYIVGALCGILMNYANKYLVSVEAQLFDFSPYVLTCALAVGLAMLLMTSLDFEHPPAAALSMGLVLVSDVFITALIAIASVITISIIKSIIKRWLINLL